MYAGGYNGGSDDDEEDEEEEDEEEEEASSVTGRALWGTERGPIGAFSYPQG